MNSNPLAKLPQFDPPRRSHAGLTRQFDVAPEPDVAHLAIQQDTEEPAEQPDAEAQAYPAAIVEDAPIYVDQRQATDDANQQLKAAVTSFAHALTRLEADSRDHTVIVLRGIAETLFPKLSSLFLAEEIGRHLPSLVPSVASAVEISASPDFLERLQTVMDDMPPLPTSCRFRPAGHLTEGQVEVSWDNGGFSYDFDGMLAVCLAQIFPHSYTAED